MLYWPLKQVGLFKKENSMKSKVVQNLITVLEILKKDCRYENMATVVCKINVNFHM